MKRAEISNAPRASRGVGALFALGLERADEADARAARRLVPRQLLYAEARLGVDRPDRLEWVSVAGQPYFLDASEAEGDGAASMGRAVDAAPSPGDRCSLIASGVELACGVVERVVERRTADRPPEVSVVACSPYQTRRRTTGLSPFTGQRVDDLARSIAARLGLRARIEEVAAIVEDLPPSDDRLAALHAVARRHGLGMAVASGTLFLVRSLDGVGSVRRWTSASEGWPRTFSELHVASTLEAGRALKIVRPGPLRERVLDRLQLRGFAREVDGEYRVLRASHVLTAGGWQSELLVAQEHRDAFRTLEAAGILNEVFDA